MVLSSERNGKWGGCFGWRSSGYEAVWLPPMLKATAAPSLFFTE